MWALKFYSTDGLGEGHAGRGSSDPRQSLWNHAIWSGVAYIRQARPCTHKQHVIAWTVSNTPPNFCHLWYRMVTVFERNKMMGQRTFKTLNC